MQLDQIHAYWMGPFEEWALARLGAPGLARRVDLNPLPHFVTVRSGLRWYDRPWEKEADWLTR
jgi:hypothetical protein